jgi:hypothetical protein
MRSTIPVLSSPYCIILLILFEDEAYKLCTFFKPPVALSSHEISKQPSHHHVLKTLKARDKLTNVLFHLSTYITVSVNGNNRQSTNNKQAAIQNRLYKELHLSVILNGPFQRPRGLRRVCGHWLAGIVGSNPSGGLDVCMLWVLCCHVAFCATGWSHVQRSSTECTCLSVIVGLRSWGGPDPLRLLRHGCK